MVIYTRQSKSEAVLLSAKSAVKGRLIVYGVFCDREPFGVIEGDSGSKSEVAWIDVPWEEPL